MAEADAAGAQAEVDVDAGVGAERRGVERAHTGRAFAPQVQAWAEHHRQRDALPRIRPREHAVEARDSLGIRQRIGGIEQRIAGGPAAAGERHHDADPGFALRVPGEPVEPVVGDDRVAVQDHRVAVGMQREPPVDRGGKPALRGLLDERGPPRRRERCAGG